LGGRSWVEAKKAEVKPAAVSLLRTNGVKKILALAFGKQGAKDQ
jgi:hypothetical protein